MKKRISIDDCNWLDYSKGKQIENCIKDSPKAEIIFDQDAVHCAK